MLLQNRQQRTFQRTQQHDTGDSFMSMMAQAARGIKNLWSQGDDEDEDYDLSETNSSSKYASDKYDSDKYSSDKPSSDKYAPEYGGGSGSSSRARPLRSVPIPL